MARTVCQISWCTGSVKAIVMILLFAVVESSCMSLEGIVAEVGYSDVPSFRRLFSRLTGLSPAQYRRQFRRAWLGYFVRGTDG